MNNQYYITKESVEEYIRLAKDANGGQLIRKLNKYLPPNSAVLEIGSGPGTDFQLLKETYHVVGSDFSEEFLKRLINKYSEDEFLQLEASSLTTTKKFDGIYSNKVLQHLTDEELAKSLQRQMDLLNPNGIICHSFWKGEGEEVFKGMFINYQTAATIRTFMKDKFDILILEEYNEFEDGDSLLVIAKKHTS